jgi:hypothetical protein
MIVEWVSTDPALLATIQAAEGTCKLGPAYTENCYPGNPTGKVWITFTPECNDDQQREILATDPSCLELGTCSDGASTCYFEKFARLCTISEAMFVDKVFVPFGQYTMCPTKCTDLPAPDGVAYSTCDEARAVLQARGDDWVQQHGGSNEGSPFGTVLQRVHSFRCSVHQRRVVLRLQQHAGAGFWR